MGSQIGQHDLNDNRVNGGGGVVVEVDGAVLQSGGYVHALFPSMILKARGMLYAEKSGFWIHCSSATSLASIVCNSCHSSCICCSVVRRFPIATRMVNLPCSLVCDKKKWPEALTRFMMRSLNFSRRVSSSIPCGWARKQTVLNGVGAMRSKLGDSSTHPAKSWARRTCLWIRAAN